MSGEGRLSIVLWNSCLVFLLACNLPIETENDESNPIIFSNLQVGQSSHYLSFSISGYWTQEKALEYTYDTLVVTITEEQEDGFHVTEQFLDVDTTDWWEGEDTVNYLLQVSKDTLHYRKLNTSDPYSCLFGDINPPALPLVTPTGVEVTLNGWEPVFTEGECCLGYLDNFEALDHFYYGLNVLHISYTMVDGPALWWLYSGPTGIIRHMVINAWTGAGKGWDLLP